ncbi:MAG: ankyrin repeat domain-containing protein [Acidobacteria bacterium]|nr:ankyrin repeat domain-containing protein [Acidobacteriota bacterium]
MELEVRMKSRDTSRWNYLAGRVLVCLLLFPGVAPAADSRVADAARGQDRAAVQALIRSKADVNAPQSDGATALAWAAHWDDLEMADLLLRAGAKVDAANRLGWTPLSLACQNGTPAMIEKLLRAGADPKQSTPTGETPLMTAAGSGSVRAIQLLIEHGADVNAREKLGGQTALMWAISERHPDAAKALIEHGADVRSRSTGGFTPLLFAAQQGDIAATQLLLQAGADVDDASGAVQSNRGAFTAAGYMRVVESRGQMTPLLLATISGQEEMAIFLAEHGANPNASDSSGSVLHYAVRKGIVYVNRQDSNGMGDSPLARRPNMTRLAKVLLDKGANPNVRLKRNPESGSLISPVGATPLVLAAASSDVELVRMLLDHGADPSIATEKNTTALMLAAGVGRSEDRLPGDETGALEAIKLLLAHGAKPDAVNQDDAQCALHGAARIGSNDIIEYLVQQGARMEVMDSMGQTPLSLASGVITKGTYNVSKSPFGPHPSTVELLRRLGAKSLEEAGVQVMDVVKDSATPLKTSK